MKVWIRPGEAAIVVHDDGTTERLEGGVPLDDTQIARVWRTGATLVNDAGDVVKRPDESHATRRLAKIRQYQDENPDITKEEVRTRLKKDGF